MTTGFILRDGFYALFISGLSPESNSFFFLFFLRASGLLLLLNPTGFEIPIFCVLSHFHTVALLISSAPRLNGNPLFL